jgi:hypothetical protein
MEKFILFTPQTDLIPISELFELTGNEAITPLGNPDAPTGYVCVWQDVHVVVERLSDEAYPHAQNDLLEFVQAVLGDRNDSKAQKHLRRVDTIHHALHVTIEPSQDDSGKAKNLIMGIMTYYEGSFFFANHALYNDEGKRIFGYDDTPPRYFREVVIAVSDEAKTRKDHSLKRLSNEKVPFIKHLPVIADSTEATPRPLESIVPRLFALVLIAEKAEGMTLADYEAKVAQYDLREAVSADEWAFAHTDDPIKQDVIKFSQRLESAWVLAWALGYNELLGRPDAFCDVALLRELLAKHTVASCVQHAKLMGLHTLLDETDLIFRYHWAVNDAELYGTRIPAKLIPAVTYERHYALRWLVSGDDWDTVNTDT